MSFVHRTALSVVWGLAAVTLIAGTPGWSQAQPAAGGAALRDDFRWIRGVNYVPSYARNDVQIWADYDPTVIDRELGYAARLKLNSVRIFLQYIVYERDPQEFLRRFDSFLALCAKHGIRAMPVVFDSCFGELPDLKTYRDRDWVANPGQDRLGPEHWPKLEQYVRDVVGRHRGDKRIVIWDVMNEPTCTSHAATEEGRARIWTFLDHFLGFVKQVDPDHPTTVGVESSTLIPKVLSKIDVVAFHNYQRDLREDIGRVRQMAAASGKPVVINEVVRRDSQPFAFAMPILAEERIGWYVWELMLGNSQFARGEDPIQGFIHPDGTCRDAADVAWILQPSGTKGDPRHVAERAGFPQRHWGRDTDPAVQYSDGWTLWRGPGPLGCTLHYHNRAGGTAEIAFEGTGITLIHKVGPDCGMAQLRLDGNPATKTHGGAIQADSGSAALLDTYADRVEWNHRTLAAQGLAPGKHTLKIVVTGRRQPESSNSYVQIVGFAIVPPPNAR